MLDSYTYFIYLCTKGCINIYQMKMIMSGKFSRFGGPYWVVPMEPYVVLGIKSVQLCTCTQPVVLFLWSLDCTFAGRTANIDSGQQHFIC